MLESIEAGRILLIDDDHHLLAALQRQLGDSFDITTAQGGKEAVAAALGAVEDRQVFAVAVCDMRMPGMDGIETLRQIREVSPDTVRVMLTGNADQQTAIDAINRGSIFRFYTKPCSTDLLSEGLVASIEQYRLVTAERDLLEQTLTGSIQVLSDVISLNNPAAYRLATRLRDWVRLLTVSFGMPHRWQLEVAASLVPIGQVAIPAELLGKHQRHEPLSNGEQSIIDSAPEWGSRLVANIPRLAKVAEIVYLQDRGYDGSGFPFDGPKGGEIPLDARLLKILKDLAMATGGGPLTKEAFAALASQSAKYDPVLLAKVRSCLEATLTRAVPPAVELPVAKLYAGQTILSDVKLDNGHVVIPANTLLSEPHIRRLANLRKIFTFQEPVRVKSPED